MEVVSGSGKFGERKGENGRESRFSKQEVREENYCEEKEKSKRLEKNEPEKHSLIVRTFITDCGSVEEGV